jgi:biotin-dependent carboxylase-like uncharacterized protein
MAEGAPLAVAMAGGAFQIRLGRQPLPATVVLRLHPGARLSIHPGAWGAWCYLAVLGNFVLPSALGSVSTHVRSGLGRPALGAGDFLPVEPADSDLPPAATMEAPWLKREAECIRVSPGPQQDYFHGDQLRVFFETRWRVSSRSDRMAYMLEGPQLESVRGFNIVSDAIAVGAVQISGEGRPMVLMADGPPTGGYPKIATVIGPDVGRLAQLRPGREFRFVPVSIPGAVQARQTEATIFSKPPSFRTVSLPFPAEQLLRDNLIAGVTDGTDSE